MDYVYSAPSFASALMSLKSWEARAGWQKVGEEDINLFFEVLEQDWIVVMWYTHFNQLIHDSYIASTGN